MSFTENEAVTVGFSRVGGIHIKDAVVEDGKDVRCGKHTSDVSAFAAVHHSQTVETDGFRQFCTVFKHLFSFL